MSAGKLLYRIWAVTVLCAATVSAKSLYVAAVHPV
jgi:hypothetical protein